MNKTEYKTIICRGYCKYHGIDRADKCGECGDFCRNFELSEIAQTMIGEELLEEVTPFFDRYLDAAKVAFAERLAGGQNVAG